MILYEATIKYKGYYVDRLHERSSKRICCSCDKCGRVRYVRKSDYRDLCQSCKQKNRILSEETKQKISKSSPNRSGKNNPMYGKDRSGNRAPFYNKHHTLESRIKNSCSSQEINIKDFNGFVHNVRDHVLPINQCTQLNKRFFKSEGHHILSNVVIFIPKDLHRSIYHNMRNGKGMNEINKLTIDYLVGDF